jgi:hypothetical protein
MGNRRFTTLECGALHQSFLPAECKAGGAQGSYRFRGAAFHRSRGGDNLQLRTRIFRVLLQGNRLPLQIMPRKDEQSPRQEERRGIDCICQAGSMDGTTYPHCETLTSSLASIQVVNVVREGGTLRHAKKTQNARGPCMTPSLHRFRMFPSAYRSSPPPYTGRVAVAPETLQPNRLDGKGQKMHPDAWAGSQLAMSAGVPALSASSLPPKVIACRISGRHSPSLSRRIQHQ